MKRLLTILISTFISLQLFSQNWEQVEPMPNPPDSKPLNALFSHNGNLTYWNNEMVIQYDPVLKQNVWGQRLDRGTIGISSDSVPVVGGSGAIYGNKVPGTNQSASILKYTENPPYYGDKPDWYFLTEEPYLSIGGGENEVTTLFKHKNMIHFTLEESSEEVFLYRWSPDTIEYIYRMRRWINNTSFTCRVDDAISYNGNIFLEGLFNTLYDRDDNIRTIDGKLVKWDGDTTWTVTDNRDSLWSVVSNMVVHKGGLYVFAYYYGEDYKLFKYDTLNNYWDSIPNTSLDINFGSGNADVHSLGGDIYFAVGKKKVYKYTEGVGYDTIATAYGITGMHPHRGSLYIGGNFTEVNGQPIKYLARLAIADFPVAGFEASKTSGCGAYSVQFTDTSLNDPDSWYWEFEGGTPSTSTAQNPTVQYDSAGTYSVTLRVSNLAGEDTLIKSSLIVVDPIPVADAGEDTSICRGQSVQLSGSGEGDYSWTPPVTLDDPNSQNPVAKPNNTTTYTLIVENNDGCSDTAEVTITVNPLPDPTISGLSDTYCVDDDPVTIMGDPSGGVFSGNGISGNTFAPSDAGVGTHTITYTYTDDNGCTGGNSEVVTVDSCLSDGIEEISITNLSVYPNPVTDRLCIDGLNKDYSASLHSISGREVRRYESIRNGIDLSWVDSGVYFLRVSGITIRIVKK